MNGPKEEDIQYFLHLEKSQLHALISHLCAPKAGQFAQMVFGKEEASEEDGGQIEEAILMHHSSDWSTFITWLTSANILSAQAQRLKKRLQQICQILVPFLTEEYRPIPYRKELGSCIKIEDNFQQVRFGGNDPLQPLLEFLLELGGPLFWKRLDSLLNPDASFPDLPKGCIDFFCFVEDTHSTRIGLKITRDLAHIAHARASLFAAENTDYIQHSHLDSLWELFVGVDRLLGGSLPIADYQMFITDCYLLFLEAKTHAQPLANFIQKLLSKFRSLELTEDHKLEIMFAYTLIWVSHCQAFHMRLGRFYKNISDSLSSHVPVIEPEEQLEALNQLILEYVANALSEMDASAEETGKIMARYEAIGPTHLCHKESFKILWCSHPLSSDAFNQLETDLNGLTNFLDGTLILENSLKNIPNPPITFFNTCQLPLRYLTRTFTLGKLCLQRTGGSYQTQSLKKINVVEKETPYHRLYFTQSVYSQENENKKILLASTRLTMQVTFKALRSLSTPQELVLETDHNKFWSWLMLLGYAQSYKIEDMPAEPNKKFIHSLLEGASFLPTTFSLLSKETETGLPKMLAWNKLEALYTRTPENTQVRWEETCHTLADSFGEFSLQALRHCQMQPRDYPLLAKQLCYYLQKLSPLVAEVVSIYPKVLFTQIGHLCKNLLTSLPRENNEITAEIYPKWALLLTYICSAWVHLASHYFDSGRYLLKSYSQLLAKAVATVLDTQLLPAVVAQSLKELSQMLLTPPSELPKLQNCLPRSYADAETCGGGGGGEGSSLAEDIRSLAEASDISINSLQAQLKVVTTLARLNQKGQHERLSQPLNVRITDLFESAFLKNKVAQYQAQIMAASQHGIDKELQNSITATSNELFRHLNKKLADAKPYLEKFFPGRKLPDLIQQCENLINQGNNAPILTFLLLTLPKTSWLLAVIVCNCLVLQAIGKDLQNEKLASLQTVISENLERLLDELSRWEISPNTQHAYLQIILNLLHISFEAKEKPSRFTLYLQAEETEIRLSLTPLGYYFLLHAKMAFPDSSHSLVWPNKGIAKQFSHLPQHLESTPSPIGTFYCKPIEQLYEEAVYQDISKWKSAVQFLAVLLKVELNSFIWKEFVSIDQLEQSLRLGTPTNIVSCQNKIQALLYYFRKLAKIVVAERDYTLFQNFTERLEKVSQHLDNAQSQILVLLLGYLNLHLAHLVSQSSDDNDWYPSSKLPQFQEAVAVILNAQLLAEETIEAFFILLNHETALNPSPSFEYGGGGGGGEGSAEDKREFEFKEEKGEALSQNTQVTARLRIAVNLALPESMRINTDIELAESLDPLLRAKSLLIKMQSESSPFRNHITSAIAEAHREIRGNFYFILGAFQYFSAYQPLNIRAFYHNLLEKHFEQFYRDASFGFLATIAYFHSSILYSLIDIVASCQLLAARQKSLDRSPGNLSDKLYRYTLIPFLNKIENLHNPQQKRALTQLALNSLCTHWKAFFKAKSKSKYYLVLQQAAQDAKSLPISRKGYQFIKAYLSLCPTEERSQTTMNLYWPEGDFLMITDAVEEKPSAYLGILGRSSHLPQKPPLIDHLTLNRTQSRTSFSTIHSGDTTEEIRAESAPLSPSRTTPLASRPRSASHTIAAVRVGRIGGAEVFRPAARRLIQPLSAIPESGGAEGTALATTAESVEAGTSSPPH